MSTSREMQTPAPLKPVGAALSVIIRRRNPDVAQT